MKPESTDLRGRGLLIWIGGVALLFAMLVDAAAVLLRHLKWSILGSIELVQAAMLIASAAAIVCATLSRGHATVHLLLNRLGPAGKQGLQKAGSLLASLFFVFLTAAAVLALRDMWGAHERSDLLHIPFVPLRILCAIATAAASVILLIQGLRRHP